MADYQWSTFSNTAQDPYRKDRWTESQQQGIADAFNTYRNDPAMLKQLMAQTGVTAQDIGNIVGMDPYVVNSTINPVTFTRSPGASGAGDGRDWAALIKQQGGTEIATDAQPSSIFGGGGAIGRSTVGSSDGQGGLGIGGGFNASISGKNPYLEQLGQTMVDQMTTNFNRNVMPAVGSQAMATGGYGGSRQGVVESNAMNDLNNSIGSALANLYNSGYGSSLNYNLGMGNLGLGYANLDRNINNDNIANQMMGANFGLGIFDRLMGNNQSGTQTGQQIQDAPMNYWQQFANSANAIGQGFGTSSTSGPGGNPLLGALGGAQLGGQVSNWWGQQQNQNAWNTIPQANVYFGNGSMGD